MAKEWKPKEGRIDMAGQGLWLKGHLQCVVDVRHLSILHDLRMSTEPEVKDCINAFWPKCDRDRLLRFNVYTRLLNKRGKNAGPRFLILLKPYLYESPFHMEVDLVRLGVNRDQITSGKMVLSP